MLFGEDGLSNGRKQGKERIYLSVFHIPPAAAGASGVGMQKLMVSGHDFRLVAGPHQSVADPWCRGGELIEGVGSDFFTTELAFYVVCSQ